MKQESFEQILYNSGLERLEAEKLDEQFRAQKAREESKKLSKISQFLITAWELTALLAKLKDGESLVINSDGSLEQGRVKHEKLTKLREKISTGNENDFDTEGFREYNLRSKSFVHGKSPTWKNWWDLVKANKNREYFPVIADDFLEAMQNFVRENPDNAAKIQRKTITSSRGFKEVEITIPGFPVTCAFHETSGKFSYYIIGGQKYE